MKNRIHLPNPIRLISDWYNEWGVWVNLFALIALIMVLTRP